MTPELFIAIAAVATMVGGLVWWISKTSASAGKALLELAICKSDVAKIQTEVQQLRDSKVEHSTLIAQVMTHLSKLDKIETLAASVAALTSSVSSLAASVERLERKVDARREDDRHA
jgi:uncharacterized protein YoxC